MDKQDTIAIMAAILFGHTSTPDGPDDDERLILSVERAGKLYEVVADRIEADRVMDRNLDRVLALQKAKDEQATALPPRITHTGPTGEEDPEDTPDTDNRWL
jgi:hypothetical protein